MTAEARGEVRLSATALAIISAVSVLVLVATVVANVYFLASGAVAALDDPPGMTKETQILIRMTWELVMLGLNIVSFLGALQMRRLRSYRLARLGAIFACIPCVSPCVVLGIPFGLAAYVALNRPVVRAAYGLPEA